MVGRQEGTSNVVELSRFIDVSLAKEVFLRSSCKPFGNGFSDTRFGYYFNVLFCSYLEKRVTGMAAMGGTKGVLSPLKLKYQDVSFILQCYITSANDGPVDQAHCTGNGQKPSVAFRPSFTDRRINGAVYEFLLFCVLRACLTTERTFPVANENIGICTVFKLGDLNGSRQQAAATFSASTHRLQVSLPYALTTNADISRNDVVTCHRNRLSSAPKYAGRLWRTKERVHVVPPPFLLVQSKDRFMLVFQPVEASEIDVVPSFPRAFATKISFSNRRSGEVYDIALSAPFLGHAFLEVMKSVVVRTSLHLFIYKTKSSFGHWKHLAIGSTLDHLHRIEMEPAARSSYPVGAQRILFTSDHHHHPLNTATLGERTNECLEGARCDQEFRSHLEPNESDSHHATLPDEEDKVASAENPRNLPPSNANVEKEDTPENSSRSASSPVPAPLNTSRQHRSLSESSADQEPIIVRRGILKNSDWRRTVSESSDDVAYGSSLDSESMFPALSLDSIQRKKSVSFNDHISRMVYRVNSSILGRRRKNQKKAANKKRAAARIAACHSESTDTSGISSSSEASLEDLSSAPNLSLPEARQDESITP